MQDDPNYGRYKSSFLSDLGRWWDSLFPPVKQADVDYIETRTPNAAYKKDGKLYMGVEVKPIKLTDAEQAIVDHLQKNIDMDEIYLNPQDSLVDFHRKFGLTVNNKPTIPEEKDIELRSNLIAEEFLEFMDASGYYFSQIALKSENDYNSGITHIYTKDYDKKVDIIGIADAIADLLYVVYGAAVTYGLDAEMLFNEVHRSNLTKVWEDGTIHRREEDGKILKPPTYSKADIQKCLNIMSDLANVEENVKEIENK